MTVDPEFHRWLTTAITIGFYLLGGGVFVGVVRNSISHLTKAVEKLGARMDAADSLIGHGNQQGAVHDARLNAAEKAADAALEGYHALVERLAAFQAETKADHGYTREKLESLERQGQNHARQLGNIATNRAGEVYEFRHRGEPAE